MYAIEKDSITGEKKKYQKILILSTIFKQAKEMTNLKKRHDQNIAEISKERPNSNTLCKPL